MARLEPGRIVADRYKLLRVLGEGGMGTVFEAEDVRLRRKVALKFVLRQLADHPEALQRFRNEAIAAARIRNPHIVTILDFGSDEGFWYIAQELLEGCDLAVILAQEGPLNARRVIALAVQACYALTAAHEAGFVHRDIKPANLFVAGKGGGDEHLVLLDFGIAKLRNVSREEATKSGAVMGSPLYMSPEQIQDSRNVDHRTDIFSLGTALYELLTGRTPFAGTETLPELFYKLIQELPLSPHAVRPEISPELSDVIMRCLAKDRNDRYDTASALRAALLSVPEAENLRAGNTDAAASSINAHGAYSGTLSGAPPPLTGPTTGSFMVTQGLRGPSRWDRSWVQLAAAAALACCLWGLWVARLRLASALETAWKHHGIVLVAVGSAGGSYLLVRWAAFASRARQRKAGVAKSASASDLHAHTSVANSTPSVGQPSHPIVKTVPIPGVPGSADVGQQQLTRFLAAAGLRAVGRRGSVAMLERVVGAQIPDLNYAALAVEEGSGGAAVTTMATVYFQSRAQPLYELQGTQERPVYVIALLESLPGPGVYKEWHCLSVDRHVRVLPLTPQEAASAVRESAAAQFVMALLRRSQRDAFEHVGPVTSDIDFFGRRQLAQLVGNVVGEGTSFALFGLEKWGTTSLLLRLRSELGDRPSAWIDLAANPQMSPEGLRGAVTSQLRKQLARANPHMKAPSSHAAVASSAELDDAIAECLLARTNQRPVVFVDRVDELLHWSARTPDRVNNILHELYSLAFPPPGFPRVVLVLAGCDDYLILGQVLSSAEGPIRNPLWRSMPWYYTQFFEPTELEDFFVRLGPLAGLDFTKTGLEEVHVKTGGHKFLCRALGSELARSRVNEALQSPIRSRDVATTARLVATRHADYLNAVFQHAPDRTQKALSRLVHGPADVVELLGIGGDGETHGGELAALQFALNFGLVGEHRGQYSLRVGLITDWLSLCGVRTGGAHRVSEGAPDPGPWGPRGVGPEAVARPPGTSHTIIGHAPPPPEGGSLHLVPQESARAYQGKTILGSAPPPDEQRALREIILKGLDSDELKIVLSDMGEPPDKVVRSGAALEQQALEAIRWAVRHNRFAELKARIRERAPALFENSECG